MTNWITDRPPTVDEVPEETIAYVTVEGEVFLWLGHFIRIGSKYGTILPWMITPAIPNPYVAPEQPKTPDPGEGWRLLDKEELPIEGDEFLITATNQWHESESWKQHQSKAGKLFYRRRIKQHAKVGDWVRDTKTGTVFQVDNVDSHGVVTGKTGINCFVVVVNSYEILTRTVEPWTMQEACVALGEQGMVITKSTGWGFDVVAVREKGLRMKGLSSKTYEELTRNYTLLNGDPCGTVRFESKVSQ